MRILRQITFDVILFGVLTALTLAAYVAHFFSPGVILALARVWARTSLWALRVLCGIQVQVSGLENLPTTGAVIAAQHQSTMDTLIWLAYAPAPAFVFKREFRRVPLFGALMEPAGMVPVDRGGGGTALRGIVEGCKRATAKGRQVVIFPEGTRTAPGQRVALKKGITALALALDVPVLPAATDSGLCWRRKSFVKTPGTVHVKIFAPLPKGLSHDEVLARIATAFYESGDLGD